MLGGSDVADRLEVAWSGQDAAGVVADRFHDERRYLITLCLRQRRTASTSFQGSRIIWASPSGGMPPLAGMVTGASIGPAWARSGHMLYPSVSLKPWKWPSNLTTFHRPVYARAVRTACQVVSVPGHRETDHVGAGHQLGDLARRLRVEWRLETAQSTHVERLSMAWRMTGLPWPSSAAPNDMLRSMYSFPSTSQTRPPSPRFAKNGRSMEAWSLAAADTPPGRTLWAATNSSSARASARGHRCSCQASSPRRIAPLAQAVQHD